MVSAARRRLWSDRFSVTEFYYDARSNSVSEITTIENQPGRLSFSTTAAARSALRPAGEVGMVNTITLTAKLFCDPQLTIKPGSRVTVTRGNHRLVFKQSGLPGIFNSHMEIPLVSADDLA